MKKIFFSSLVVLVFTSFTLAEKILKVQEIIVTQKDVPVFISSYNVFYQSRGAQKEFIEKVIFKNVSNKKIIAIRLHYIHFNVFNESIFDNKGMYVENIKPDIVASPRNLDCFEC